MDRALDPSVYGPLLRVENALSVYELENLKAYISREESQYGEDVQELPGRTRSLNLYERYGFTTNLARYCLEQYRGLVFTMDDMVTEAMIEDEWKWSDPNIAEEPLVVHETLRCSEPGVDYKSHKDLASKKLTCLIYLDPRFSGNGTVFHGKDDNKNTEYNWKYNTGYIFKPNTYSFHSYYNNLAQNRYVYMFNLYVDKKMEKVGVRKTMEVTQEFDMTEQFEKSVDKKIPI